MTTDDPAPYLERIEALLAEALRLADHIDAQVIAVHISHAHDLVVERRNGAPR